LESALPVLANTGLIGLSAVAVACNAAIHDPEIELAYESTPGAKERAFFQAYVRPEMNEVSSARIANNDGIARVFEGLNGSSDRDRLLRASNHYRLALDTWRAGRESLTLAHLWMATEALTEVECRRLLSENSFATKAQLAEKLGVAEKGLGPVIRRDHILRGDAECYSRAREASDGFEHGYLGFDVIHAHAVEVRERLARYVRTAILRLGGVPEETVSSLIGPPYDSPLGIWPLVKFIRGTLKSESDDLAAPGNAYPFVRWSYSAKSCDIDTGGKMNLQLNEVITPELALGASLSSLSFEMWSSGSSIQFATPEQAATATGKFVSAEVKTKSTDSGDVISVNDPAGDKWIRPVGSLILNCNAIRNLSLFWLERLTGEPVVAKEPAILQPLVERILAAVERAA
jgi:hypothetical protein